jgi:HAMP domain-containing protein
VTTIVEKKRDLDVLFGFLVIVIGLAAVRGAEKAPIAAAVMGAFAVALLVAWILMRQRTGRLTITGDEIAYGRVDRPPAQRILRAEASLLRFRQGRIGLRPTGWFLEPADRSSGPGILMLGFDMSEVQRACIEHGWSFA